MYKTLFTTKQNLCYNNYRKTTMKTNYITKSGFRINPHQLILKYEYKLKSISTNTNQN